MIKKFISIKGTGKFLNYTPASIPGNAWNGEFKKINLIYGENGSGKTTLAILMRSLQGDNALLPKKRAFDRTVPQKVEVLTDIVPNPKLTFDNNTWDRHYPEIEIFDIHFVSENVYTGLEIQNDHKKNLFEVIFGQQGVQLKNEIQTIKENIQSGNKSTRNVSDKIELAIDKAYSTNVFCQMSIDADIENKIVSKEAEIKAAKAFQDIRTKQQLAIIPSLLSPINTEVATDTLTKSIDTISAVYLRQFQDHKEHLGMNGKAEQWIKQGFEAISENKCPFCLRKMDETTDIVEAYKQYFNNEYNDLIQQISTLDNQLDSFNVEATILEIENVVVSNKALLEFWKQHINELLSFDDLTISKEELLKYYLPVKNSFAIKSANPIVAESADSVSAFQNKIEAVNQNISNLNIAVSAFNTKITSLKTVNTINASKLEDDLKKLKAVKKRADATIDGLCKSFIKETGVVTALNADKVTKQQQLDAYSKALFSSYSLAINKYLRSFAPYLEIRNLDSGYVGSSKEPMVKYALHINGNEIKHGDDPDQATFKYSLSEGDKSALALAFFLARLEVSGNIQNKLIVFDDPVSSFDLNRKATTISKLFNFGQQAKQLFVLTHNIFFAGEFWKSVCQSCSSHQCCQIGFIGNTSVLADYDIDSETLSSVLKDSLAIKTYLADGCLTEQDRRSVARCLRPALESYFHLKYFDLVLANEWLGTFIDKVRTSIPADPFHRLRSHLRELEEVNDYSKKYHHRFNTNCDNEPVSDVELRTFCGKTLKLIQHI